MIVKGKVLYVHSPTCVDLEMTLPLGMSMRKQVWLESVQEVTNIEDRKKATHCLVILIGGKPVFADIPEISPKGRVFTTLYRDFDQLTERFPDDVVDTVNESGIAKAFVSVNKFMEKLSSMNYDVDEVKSIVIEKKAASV